uniref:Uncharacterized protein n=1 Tax=viral metagenome TaxID=1070528 RepID=A0A6C0M1Z3_9ZZZZ
MQTPTILFVGDAGTGKTTYVFELLGCPMPKEYVPTLGMEASPIIYDDSRYTIMDFAGNPKFGYRDNDESMAGADGVVIFTHNGEGYEDWVRRILARNPNVPFVVVDSEQTAEKIHLGDGRIVYEKNAGFNILCDTINHVPLDERYPKRTRAH